MQSHCSYNPLADSSHLVCLEAATLHAMPPEGQDAVLETNCRETNRHIKHSCSAFSLSRITVRSPSKVIWLLGLSLNAAEVLVRFTQHLGGKLSGWC